MPAKPETRLIQRVHRALDPSVYAEKTNNPYRAGIPDVYYEGPTRLGMAWVEYKYRPTNFKAYTTWDEMFALASAHQQRWMARAHGNSKKVGMVVGFKDLNAMFCYYGCTPIVCPNSQSIALAIKEMLDSDSIV